MDWITGIQKALNYIEEHLTDKIDIEEAAKQACSSPFHFQRVFGIICSFTVGDYIRMRRLSLAAEELRGGAKVIDTALKYGYETPESFSRAFMRFHGVTPTEAKNGKNVKSFSRLFVKLILDGGNLMDYRIEKKEAFKLVCKRKQVNKPQGLTAGAEISPFWTDCSVDGTISRLCRYARFDSLKGILGVCFSGEFDSDSFPYAIGAEYNGLPLSDDEFEIIDIPAHTYAVFNCTGRMPEAFEKTYRQICTEFFPQSGYEYASDVELEVYPSDKTDDPKYSCEIWIAVNDERK